MRLGLGILVGLNSPMIESMIGLRETNSGKVLTVESGMSVRGYGWGRRGRKRVWSSSLTQAVDLHNGIG